MANTERDELTELRARFEQLRRESTRSAEMTAEIIIAFGEAFRRERRVLRKGAIESDGLPLEEGVTVLPLGVTGQKLKVAPADKPRRVSATALCADPSEVVMLRVTIAAAERQRVQALAGEQSDQPHGDHTALVRLIAGEPRELFEAAAGNEGTELELCRIGGAPCILRLQGVVTDDSLEKEATAARRARNSSKGTLWKAQELLREGRASRAMEVALAYATEVERPALALLRATLAQDDACWLANVNSYVERFGMAPVRLANTSAPRFLRLAADAPRTVSGGPLATVIMPAFNAEKTLELAAVSILKQSWTELELIIVDDCSSDATPEVAQRVARLDPRVRLIRNGVNVGPYVSKNLALSTARGAYVTCHDADDWAHPQRLETQIESLLANGARACVASWLRLDEAGAFSGFTAIGRQSHDGALRIAHVTCMVEAEFMRRYVGHWDCVRFGADGEMLERLEHLLGDGLVRLRVPSVLSLDTPGSLTNDRAHGISKATGLSMTRRAYRDAWRQWHATLTRDSAYVQFPQIRRPFAAPDECVVPYGATERVTATR